MSFFEKMMKINQSKTYINNIEQQSKYSENNDDNQAEVDNLKLSKISMRNREINISESRKQQILPDVPQEPKIQAVPISLQPKLITCHLPRKEQLLREMLAKKRQFNMKKLTNSNVTKGAQLKQRLQQSSTKFIQSIQTQTKIQQTVNNKPAQPIDEILPNANLAQSRAPPLTNTAINEVQADKFKKKELKQSIVLNISHNQSHKQSLSRHNGEATSSNPFQRQIMLRLINLLENERHDRKDMMAMSMNFSHQFNHQPHQQKEKQCPIIINNILKTPIDKLNKDIMQREMKIRMLQNNRSKHKYSFNQPFTQYKDDNPLTERSEYTAKCNQFNHNNTNVNNKTKAKMSVEISKIQIQEEVKQQIHKQSQSTKPSSNFTSQINEQDEGRQKKPREREFNRVKDKKQKRQAQQKQEDKRQQKPMDIPNSNKSQTIVSESVVHKAAIRLDIPLDDPSQTQGLSLAQAFKRKIGKLKSQKERSVNKNKLTEKTDEQNDAKSIITQVFNEYKTPKMTNFINPLQNSQMVNLSKQDNKGRKVSAKRSIKIHDGKQNDTSSKKSRQPSKELIDRLIGGERAKINKKQMYALTRKNYENLPQIQAKKKQQQKMKQERQRLAKLKQLQKSTRTLRKTKTPLQ